MYSGPVSAGVPALIMLSKMACITGILSDRHNSQQVFNFSNPSIPVLCDGDQQRRRIYF